MPDRITSGAVTYIGASRESLDVIGRLIPEAGFGTIRISRRVYDALSEDVRADLVSYERITEAFRDAFSETGTIFAVMACGIAVRAMAPLLTHKSADPAVLVLDPAGRFIIPVLSGHLGGANRIAEDLAGRLGMTAVITTLSDGLGRQAVDSFLDGIHYRFDDFETACLLSAFVCEGKTIGVLGAPDEMILPKGYVRGTQGVRGLICLGDQQTVSETEKSTQLPCLKAYPKRLVLGVGCRRGISLSVLEEKVGKLLRQTDLSRHHIDAVATIGRKADEPALQELCRKIGCDLVIVPDSEVRAVEPRFKGSDFVRKTTGLSCVAEPCAYVCSGHGKELCPRLREDGVSLALFEEKSRPQPAGTVIPGRMKKKITVTDGDDR